MKQMFHLSMKCGLMCTGLILGMAAVQAAGNSSSSKVQPGSSASVVVPASQEEAPEVVVPTRKIDLKSPPRATTKRPDASGRAAPDVKNVPVRTPSIVPPCVTMPHRDSGKSDDGSPQVRQAFKIGIPNVRPGTEAFRGAVRDAFSAGAHKGGAPMPAAARIAVQIEALNRSAGKASTHLMTYNALGSVADEVILDHETGVMLDAAAVKTALQGADITELEKWMKTQREQTQYYLEKDEGAGLQGAAPDQLPGTGYDNVGCVMGYQETTEGSKGYSDSVDIGAATEVQNIDLDSEGMITGFDYTDSDGENHHVDITYDDQGRVVGFTETDEKTGKTTRLKVPGRDDTDDDDDGDSPGEK